MAVLQAGDQRLADRALTIYGQDPGQPGAVAEALRCELSACLVATGRRLCDRVKTLLGPLASVDVTRIRNILDDLEGSGDISSGPRGMFAAAPLRLVRLGPDRYALHGTMPTAHLKRVLPVKDLQGGLSRSLTCNIGEAGLAAAVARFGGLILSPERWSGLDRTPLAGPEWLEELDHRLIQGPAAAGTLDQGLDTEWQGYHSDPRRRWRIERAEGTSPRLWRARHESGWWRFAWTGGVSPASAPHLRLTRDEACRTEFALDRGAGLSRTVLVREQGEEVELEVDAFVPRAEYRYLTTLGRRTEGEGPVRYRLPPSTRVEVERMLQERLGLCVTEGEGVP